METNLLFLFLGWLLGILGPLIGDRVRRSHQIEDVKRGMLTELKDARTRLAMSVYMLAARLDRDDRNLIIWTTKALKEYKGNEPKEEALKAMENLLKMTDEQIAARVHQEKF